MSYLRINFENKPSKQTPVSAENLNHMEQGIFDAHISLEELETYKANSILSKSSGTTVTTTDSAKVKPKNIKLFGKGKQRQYEGNQLLSLNEKISKGSMTWDFKNGTVHVYGDSTRTYGEIKQFTGLPSFLEVDKTYSIGRVENNMHLGFWLFDTNNNLLVTLSTETNNPATIPDNVAKATMYYAGLTNGTMYNFEQHYMLNEGATVKPFEPFVGNEPSPSMNYPQKAEFLGESGSIQSWLIARNLFAGNIVGGYLSNNGGSITNESETVKDVNCLKTFTPLSENILTVVVQGYSADMPIAYAYRIGFYDKDKKWISNVLITQEITKLQAVENAKYVRFSAGELDKMAVYFGDVSNALYEAPTSQPFTFQTPNGLRGIPLGQTIPDAIKNSPIHMSGVYHDGEQYCIGDTKNENGKDVQRIWHGNPTKTIVFTEKNTNNMCKVYDKNLFGYDGKFMGWDDVTIVGYCTHAINDRYASKNHSFSYYGATLVYTDIEKTLEEVNAMFSEIGTDIEFSFILRDPIITDTTEEEKAQLDTLVMNYPNTTIVNDEGAYMEVEYVADTQEYIKQNYVPKEEFEKLQIAVSEIQLALVNS